MGIQVLRGSVLVIIFQNFVEWKDRGRKIGEWILFGCYNGYWCFSPCYLPGHKSTLQDADLTIVLQTVVPGVTCESTVVR